MCVVVAAVAVGVVAAALHDDWDDDGDYDDAETLSLRSRLLEI